MRAQRDIYERQHYPYLPDEGWMQQAGYIEKFIGDYMHYTAGQPLYRVTVLSQSGLFLLHCDERLLKAVVVASDEDLFRLLITNGFPFPE